MARTLICRHCRFKWKPKTDNLKIPEICSNCGSRGSVGIEPDADQILRESDEMDFRTR